MKKKITRDRKVRRGPDIRKLAKIWNTLKESGTWMHVSAISQATGINESTVRWYLDNYLHRFIEEQRIAPTIKLRLVKLKSDVEFKMLIKSIEVIKDIRRRN